MNIEEAKKIVDKLSVDSDELWKIPMIPAHKVKALLDTLDQQKPEIPQFVADWIEKHKEERWWLGAALADRENEKFREWLVICDMDTRITNQDVFARAWLDGYEVEREKLYTVEIPNPNAPIEYHSKLAKNHKGEIVIEVQDWMNRTEYYQLTEQEIRKDFDWAWQWAKEVAE
ncbi:phage protein [Streptococcus canis]|uniref:DUF1642 domain-containing protein n=1 Tax=Streptococcus canis TaxID=1329 RepID=UPI000C1C37C2|nr:DUF1642 domain-containing protein [Streptococcus canis]MDV5988966.1 DUF1642 domain-containing protein [Streptococcus canis]MDV6023399.1 DUF1642 domain-containing protein [Streptococcus canis]VTS75399.1 phage protein [Streptococcus canis]GAY70492.1 uncharacterized protein TANIYAMA4_0899 [Streptococcus canis]GAY71729.1 uncharacterized protein TANIYAMA4_2373 [Streptococcus canis]